MALVTCNVLGCGGSPPVSLTGNVSFAGETVSNGSIRLDPVDIPSAKPAASKIAAGQFEIPVDKGMLPGLYRVRIFGSRPTGRTEKPRENLYADRPQQPRAETESYIPGRFNLRTTLSIELQPGDNEKDFVLE